MTVTTDLTQGYTPPGVYIAEQSNPISTATGLPPTRLTIIGRGQGAQSATEQIALTETGTRLAAKGIIESSIEVTAVSDDSEVANTEYVLDQVLVSDDTGDYYYDLSRVPTSELPDGTAVWVAYDYVPVNYTALRVLDNPADAARVYGPALQEGDPTDPDYQTINSPLTLAAQIAFANGAPQIVAVPLDLAASATSAQVRAALQEAYEKIETDYSSTIVVPLTDGLDDADSGLAASDLRGHLATSAASGYYRVGVFGQPLSSTSSPSALINDAGLRYRRLVLAYGSPQGMLYRSNASGERVTLGHQYLAAAYGARLAANPVQQSLTRQPISGFAGVAASLNNLTKNSYAASGVALTERDRSGRLVVRHGTSTDRTDLAASEPSVTRARDVMVTLLHTGLDDSGLIGAPMDDDTSLSVKSVAAGILEYCVATGTIVGYDDLQVRIASLNPSVIEMRFSYRPSFPLNYILVSFAINLNTGDVNEQQQQEIA